MLRGISNGQSVGLLSGVADQGHNMGRTPYDWVLPLKEFMDLKVTCVKVVYIAGDRIWLFSLCMIGDLLENDSRIIGGNYSIILLS